MPAKNSIKQYAEDSYYHLYNRGVEKRRIFLDQQDYNVFLSYLKTYLLPKDEEELQRKFSDPSTTYQERDKILKLTRLNNFAGEIHLLTHALMPNHFHFLVKQTSANAIDSFMNSLGTRYTMYFNRKYKRVGPLYQGVYKAVLVTSEAQLLELHRYILRQALDLESRDLKELHPCSFPEYNDKRKSDWIKTYDIRSYFSRTNPKLSYKSFIREAEDLELIGSCVIEDL